MILLKNKQKKIPINTQDLIGDAQAILNILKYSDFDLGILITTNTTIRKYNRDFRHKDAPTDILSFPNYPGLVAGKRIKPLYDDKNLGDLIISAEYVYLDAARYSVSFESRMRILLVHGICHLLGYDHITDLDYNCMARKEAFILRKLNVQQGTKK